MSLLLPSHRRLLRMRRRVWRRLHAALGEQIAPPTRELRAYERRYRDDIAVEPTPTDVAEVEQAAARADILLCGDYHSFPPAQASCLRLLEAMSRGRRPVILFVELALTRHQPHIDDFLRGTIDESTLLERLGYYRTWGFPWAGYRPLFESARRNGIPVVAINGPGSAERATLGERDSWAASVIARCAEGTPRARLLVMVGDLHLARPHLPAAIAGAWPDSSRRRMLRVFQNHDELYWRRAETGTEPSALRLAKDAFCLFNGTPWEKLDSYLAWLDAGPAAGPESAAWSCEPDVLERVLEPARALSRFLGLRPPPGDVAVYTPDDLSFTGQLGAQDDGARRVRAALKNDVYPLPDGRSIYLARLDLAHAAEAAAELLIRGDTADAGTEAVHLYARIRRRALAWFGSKLLVPARRPPLDETNLEALVTSHARNIRSEVLAGGERWVAVAAGDDLRLALRVSRAAGRDLGQALYHAFVAGSFTPALARDAFRLSPTGAECADQLRQLYRLALPLPIESSEASDEIMAPAK